MSRPFQMQGAVGAIAATFSALFGCSDAPKVEHQPPMDVATDAAPAAPIIDPGTDFYLHSLVEGDAPRLPVGYSSFGPLTALHAGRQQALTDLMDAARMARDGTAERRLAAVYNAYLDTTAAEERGLTNLRLPLAVIDDAASHADIAMAMSRVDIAGAPIVIDIAEDVQQRDQYAVIVRPADLGLSVTALTAPELSAHRDAYHQLIMAWIGLLGGGDDGGRADAVLAAEVALATATDPLADADSPSLRHAIIQPEDLHRLAPQWPWAEILEGLGLSRQTHLIIDSAATVTRRAEVFPQFPVPVWQDVVRIRLLTTYGDLLPHRYAAAYQTFLVAVDAPLAATRPADRAMAEVARWFPVTLQQAFVVANEAPATKDSAERIAANIVQAFLRRIDDAPWLSPASRQASAAKLGRLSVKMGYPDEWPLRHEIVALDGDAIGNRQRAAQKQFEERRASLHRPGTASLWTLPVYAVGAHYDHRRHEIVFPLGILAPPFLDPAGDPAANYGALGTMIGHEISHAFDAVGQRTHADGYTDDWWPDRDIAAYADRAAALVPFLDAAFQQQNWPRRGEAVLDEAVGDLIGLQVAFDAFAAAYPHLLDAEVEGYTGRQRFFLSWARAMARTYHPDDVQRRVLHDRHPLAPLRINAILPHVDAWYDAFDITADDPLYVSPARRVRVW